MKLHFKNTNGYYKSYVYTKQLEIDESVINIINSPQIISTVYIDMNSQYVREEDGV